MKWLNVAFNVCVVITFIILYSDMQKLGNTKPDCTVKVDEINAKLYSYELKLDRMHQILKMKTYNNLLNQKRKVK